MDRERFGRALGAGARQATRALMEAAQAAAAPDPREGRAGRGGSAAGTGAAAGARQAAERVAAVRAQAGRMAAEAPRAARKSMLQPVKRFTSVVMLQVVGTFFALFAVSLCVAACKAFRLLRVADMRNVAWHFYLELGMAALFVYFAVSSFVRARRMERG